MGVTVHGFDEWRRVLETVPERIPKVVVPVMKRAGGNIKDDWKAVWESIKHPRTHIPHLVRGLGYDPIKQEGFKFELVVGVNPRNRQAFLSKIIEYGTLTSAPHPGGEPALRAEIPRTLRYVEKVLGDLLEKP